MENNKKKCSSKKHPETDAVSYCQDCKKYFCTKCQNAHSQILEDHKIINLDKIDEVFIDICKEENHNEKLKFFCKDHNTLCCSACTSKIKKEGYGLHSDCDVCLLKEIQGEKKNKLKENINTLEELDNQIEKSINELKRIFEQINKNKEELKLKVQKIFTKIRKALNDKEDKLISQIDEEFNQVFFKEELINKSEKLPKQIKKSIEKGKKIDKDWEENNLCSLINDCINIENNIKEINQINDNIDKYKINQDYKIDFNISEDETNVFINDINNFGKIISDNNLYDEYLIEKKNPAHILQNHTNRVNCLCTLKDRRLVSGSGDCSIIIYNAKTYEQDIIIKEHNGGVNCLSTLNSGLLASCSSDKSIKLFSIKGMNYNIFQTINNHNDEVYKIIELENKSLVSCSKDSSIIFYKKANNKYEKDFQISTNGSCTTVLQTKKNEICYSEYQNDNICFYDFLEKKIKASISNISKNNGKNNGLREWFLMIRKDLLLIPGYYKLSIINTEQYQLVKEIKNIYNNWVSGVCMLSKNMLLTGDDEAMLRQWKIEGDDLILISLKGNAHNSDMAALLNLGNGYIASCSTDCSIKIW